MSSVLCIKDSLEFREKLGESKIQSYIHDLATEGKKVVEKVWKSKALIEKDELITGMFAIQIPEEFNKYPLDKLEEDLIENDKTYVKLIRYKNHNYVRFCCQIINELQEIESSANLIYQKLLKTNSST